MIYVLTGFEKSARDLPFKSNIIHLDDLYLDFMYWYYINNSELPKMNKQTIITAITYYIPKVQMRRKIIYNVKFLDH